MTALQFAGAAVAILILASTFVPWLNQWMMFLLAFLYGSFTAMEYPARQAFTGRVVLPHQMVSARGLYSATCATTLALGQLLAGLIIESAGEWGERACFILNAVSYMVAAALLVGVGLRRGSEGSSVEPLTTAVATTDTTTLSEKLPAASAAPTMSRAACHHAPPSESVAGSGLCIKYCLSYIFSCEVVLMSFVQTIILVLFCMRYTTFLPAFASEIFHGGAGASGLLNASLAIGYAIAAFFCGGIRRKEDLVRIASGSLLILPAALVLFSLAPNLMLGATCIFIMAFLQSANINSCVATMQTTAPDKIFGRLMGLRVTLIALVELVGAFIAGQLVNLLGLSCTMILVASLGAIFTVWVCSRRFSPGPLLIPAKVFEKERK